MSTLYELFVCDSRVVNLGSLSRQKRLLGEEAATDLGAVLTRDTRAWKRPKRLKNDDLETGIYPSLCLPRGKNTTTRIYKTAPLLTDSLHRHGGVWRMPCHYSHSQEAWTHLKVQQLRTRLQLISLGRTSSCVDQLCAFRQGT